MQVVILCGGTGTRMKELTELTPKPLVPIGGKPMIWHIMQLYMHYGFDDFVLALGYKQEAFKMYFANYLALNYNTSFDIGVGRKYSGIEHYEPIPSFKVSLIDTGINSLKGERLRQLDKYIIGNTFMVSYGDGLSNVNLVELLAFHKRHGRIGTITGVQVRSKFGEVERHTDGRVFSIKEKPKNGMLTNGGFMVFNSQIFDYLWEDCDLEVGPLEKLARNGELYVYEHKGFWKNADTLKDLEELQTMWNEGNTPWLINEKEGT